MKTPLSFLAALLAFWLLLPLFSAAPTYSPLAIMPLGEVDMLNMQFKKGEKIHYLAHYGFINAGEATVEIAPEYYEVSGNRCYKVDVVGKTIGLFGLTVKVNDLWRSYIDTKSYIPRKFYRNINENKYHKEETVIFDHLNQQAKVRYSKRDKKEVHKEYQIPANVQDMISGYYFLRRVDYSKLQKGQIITMPAFFEDKVYQFQVKYEGKETIKTKIGKFECYVMQPIMPENSIFSGKNAVKFWMSADEHRIPLKIRAEMFIGGVEVEITKYEG
jgi:hypothetical protein